MTAENSPLDLPHGGRATTPPDLSVDVPQLRIAVIHPRDHDGEVLLRQLQRLRCQVQFLWPPPERVELEADIAFCILQNSTYAFCTELMRARQVAIVGIVDAGGNDATRLIVAIEPQVVLTKPIDATAILTNLLVAYKNSRYQKRLLNKIAKLEETLRSTRTVERAKLILMKARNIEEPEAYSYLREQAMKKRMSIGAVAAVVVESSNILLGDKN
jgi:AmiR/NasT family two-component response regulator